MKRALVVTAYDRPNLLQSTLDSLSRVRGLEDWDLYISIDPCEDAVLANEVLMVAVTAFPEHTHDVLTHSENMGVLRHPHVVFESLFEAGYGYVLRLEDDMLFTEDLLEYHVWASTLGSNPFVKNLGFVESRSGAQETGEMNDGPADEIVGTWQFGSPLAIGTWPGSWVRLFRDTWDSDYSTNNGTPGVEAGWDWNLKRIYPRLGLVGLRPAKDKVFHTGIVGAHSTPEVYEVRPPLEDVPEPLEYRLRLLDYPWKVAR